MSGRGNRSVGSKLAPSADLSTADPTGLGPDWNVGHRGGSRRLTSRGVAQPHDNITRACVSCPVSTTKASDRVIAVDIL
jgi:hypothetical protein